MTASLAPPPTDFAPSAYPEGVWRMPLAIVLLASRSAYVDVIRKRQAWGGVVEADVPVWRQGGLYFAHVRLRPQHRDARALGAEVALVLPLHDWIAAGLEPAPTFGKRKTTP